MAQWIDATDSTTYSGDDRQHRAGCEVGSDPAGDDINSDAEKFGQFVRHSERGQELFMTRGAEGRDDVDVAIRSGVPAGD